MSVAGDYQTAERMGAKLRAVPLPEDLTGKTVLDVGTDHGFWARECAERGAARVLGLDRGREVRGRGFVDLVARNRAQGWERCEFEYADLGTGPDPWPSFGRFDLVLALAVYHHVFGNCGDHGAIWRWLRAHTAEGGTLLWDGPVDLSDGPARMRARAWRGVPYDRETILAAAAEHFTVEELGPALYARGRVVLRCRPRRVA